ncbi:MAG: polysaccharide biosynthesis C-terminal domain-containing protein [Alphaproteobacteria bacterium]|nr:polysaccharide biosynthesis C-terminal domain-containing protein [Alphaproteobacteria bacterium]
MGAATHSRIARSVVVVGMFLVVGRALGAGREILLAAKYGTGEVMDAYLFLWNLANWPISVWLSVLTVVAVPIFVRSVDHPDGAAAVFVRELTALSGVIGLGLAMVMMAMAFSFAHLTPSVFGAGTARELVAMALPMSLMLPAGLIVGALSARCISLERHINTLAEGVPALVVIICIVSFFDHTSAALAWGTAIGYCTHAVALAFALPPADAIFETKLHRMQSSPLWPSFWSGFWMIAVGQLILSATTILDQLLIAQLGTGAISELGYANRVLALILGIGTTAVARATLPVLSALRGEGGPVQTASKLAQALFAIGALSIVPLWFASPWIIEILFERGAFGPAQTAAVTTILRIGLLQMPFYFASLVAVQVLAARQQYRGILQISVLNVAVKVAGNFVFIDIYGVAGVLVGTALMYASAMMTAWYLVSRSESR